MLHDCGGRPLRIRGGFALLGAALPALLACADTSPGATSRSFVDVSWDTTFLVGGQLQDSLLLIPRLLAAGAGRIYVYDYGDSRLKAFNEAGAPLWMTGRSGAGPEEFGNPFDMDVGPDGDIWLVDAGNGRLTRVSDDGDFVSSISLRGTLIRDVIPLRHAVLGTPAITGESMWVMLDDSARVVRSGPLPLPSLREANPNTRQTAAAVGSDGSTWAAIYPFGNILVVYRGEGLLCHGTLIEGAAMSSEPPPSPAEAVISGVSVVVTDSSVLVLARGSTDAALRMLDEYLLPECRYRRTYRLPNRMVTAARIDDVLVFTYEAPVPAMIGLRPGL